MKLISFLIILIFVFNLPVIGQNLDTANSNGEQQVVPCDQSNSRQNLDNTIAIHVPNQQRIATDLEVPADEVFILNTITANIDVIETDPGIASGSILFFTSAANGTPDIEIASEFDLVPTSQVFIEATGIGSDLYEITFDLPNPVSLSGGTGTGEKYWVQIIGNPITAGNYVGWENTTENIVGSGFAINLGGPWVIVNTNDMIYTFSGDCDILGKEDFTIGRSKVQILPNPASDSIEIVLPESFQKDNLNVVIHNVSGKIVYSENFSNGNVDISFLKSGLYFVKVSDGFSNDVIKILKN